MLTHATTSASYTEFKRIFIDQITSGPNIGSIIAIEQDRRGFIWIGSEFGLARFDGEKAKRYSVTGDSSSLDGTYINDVTVAPDGTLWVATERGVSYLNEATDQFHQIQPFPGNDNLNRIAAIAVDSKNEVILARANGISIYDHERRLFKHFELPSSLRADVVTVHVDSQNNIWLGTNGAGAAYFNQVTHRYSFYQHDPQTPGSLADDHVTYITEDNLNRVWIGTQTGGISRLDPGANLFKQYRHSPTNPRSLGNNFINHIYQDSLGLIWIAIDHGGLALFNEEHNDFQTFTHNTYDTTSLASNQLRRVLEDKRGDLWVATFPAGLNYFNRATLRYRNFHYRPDVKNSLSHSSVLSFMEDSDGEVWVGTEKGLNLFHQASGDFTRYMPDKNNSEALQAGAVIALAEDNKKQIWVGTWSGGLHRLNKATGKFVNYAPSEQPGSIQSAFIWAITPDSMGRLWIGTEGEGMALYQAETDTFKHFTYNPDVNSINHNYVWSILEDHQGQLWIGTTAGLNRFNPDTQEFFNFPRAANDPYTVDSDRIRTLFQDKNNNIWIGTQEAGIYIYDFNTQKFTKINTENGLPSPSVTGFIEDDNGYIWATTTNGVARIDTKTLSIMVLNKNHGLSSNNFYRPANYKDPDGRLYLGSADGFSIFDPNTAEQYPANASVYFTGIATSARQQKNKDIPPPKIIKKDDKYQVTIPYLDSVFNLEFSSLDYRSGDNKRFLYRLKGFNKNWTELHNENIVTYTNLSPGNYVFSVKAGTLSGWSDKISELYITVTPPPWKSWWAYSLYLLCIAAIIYLIMHTKVKQLQLTGEREINGQLRSLNTMKDAFLANTSHELRTPLNGIIGIAETLRDRNINHDLYTVRNLDLIISCGKRLATLINDILDYSKLANQKLELNIKTVDIYALVQTVFTLLEPLTKDKKITLSNNIQHLAPFVQADENRIQQILINLIGNGIKYTDEGSITVDFKIRDELAYISVIDTGLGIAQSKQAEIFEAFHQIENNDEREYDGTGLGLAITRQLVELHGGGIWVDSQPGKGTTFTFTLPAASEKDAKLRPIPQAPEKPTTSSDTPSTNINATPNAPRNARDQTILIVDDDSVNRIVLEGILSLHHYNTLEADSGKTAIEMVQQYPSIDLIIMDVMMPGMSGYEACTEIRKTHEIHYLPILFLTAKNSDEDLQKCFEVGGNDFLNKPVNKNDLLARLANHLRLQAAVRKLQLGL